MKKLLPFFFLLMPCTESPAQKQGNELIDSLTWRLKSAIEDTGKVRLLGKLSFQYYRFDTDSGIYYAEKAIMLAEQLNWDLGLAFSYNYLGTNYAVKGNYPKALEYFHKSLSKYTAIGDKQGVAFLCNNLGNFYRIRKEFPKAIEFIQKAIAININGNNKLDLAKNYNNLGSVYNLMANYPKSNDFYLRALSLAREINNQELVALLLTNIAENKSKMKDYCEALELGLEAIKISEELDADYDRAVYCGYVAEIYFLIASDSVKVTRQCRYYFLDKHKDLLYAEKYLIISIQLLEKINDQALLSENSLLLSQVYEKLGDDKNALVYYKKYSTNKDSVFSNDNNVKIAIIEKKREVELKDQQIIIQQLMIEKKNALIATQVVLLILFVLMTALISYYFYRKRKKQKAIRIEEERKKEQNDILKQNEILESRVAERTRQLESINRELTFHTNEIEQFTYIATHDLQEPLRTLSSFSGIIKEEYGGKLDDDGNKYIDFIYQSSNRMTELVRGLLEFSLLGKTRETTIVDCNDVVAEVLADMGGSIQESNARITVQDLPMVNGCATELRLLFQNLINNAIKYRNRDVPPEITISAEKHHQEWVFAIHDNGIGIPEKDRERIFIIFKRLHNRNEYGGTGIGLAHCKKIVELHGGNIRVEPGKENGSIFKFSIPV
jgi:signal transduction histidine kinase